MNLRDYKFGGIKALRKAGCGNWKAIRVNFGVYEYHGLYLGNKYVIKSFFHFSPLFDGDDDSFETLWHIYKNGNEILWASSDPISLFL